MRKIITLCLSICLLLPVAWSQDIWPGDVNNNGRVTGVDLLYWGLAFGDTGPARATVTTDWAAQPLPDLWTNSFPDGVNYAYADCNGDGVVNEDDFDDAIEENFGLEHRPPGADGYANAAGSAPRLRLTPSTVLVEPGAMVDIGLSLDDSEQPLGNFYGLALKLSYSTGLLEGDDGPDFDLVEDSWIEIDQSYVQDLYVDADGAGTAELAITRTNQQGVAASREQFGSFSIIVEDIIVGLEVDTFTLRIDSVYLINEQFAKIPVVPDTTQIVIARDTSKLSTATTDPASLLDESWVVVYPNPARDWLNLRTELPLEAISLVDQFGRPTSLELPAGDNGHYQLALGTYPPGIYWLMVRTELGLSTQKLVITPD